ncbi:hypothetical protein DFH27DRAFT_587339 [Peziza echinospora]|nr:hypothetical protein DFH27DRAFT_587339 [Peziza echinospora]
MASYEGFLESPLFRLELEDPGFEQCTDAPASNSEISPDRTTNTPTPASNVRPSLYIHKALLASLSVELSKHTHNDMKEGRENSMILKEVDKATLVRFIEWAYTRSYQHPLKISNGLLVHAKLYALADRFNVTSLRDLAFSKCTALLVEYGELSDTEDIIDIVGAMRFAFENLPSRNMFDNMNPTVGGSFSSASIGDKSLLVYLGKYASWNLDSLKAQKDFVRLIEDNAEFAKAVLCYSVQATDAPWVPRTSLSHSKHHILRRKCGNSNCQRTAIAVIQCPNCRMRDCDSGIEVNVPGQTLPILPIGAERLTGDRNGNYTWKCQYCQHTRHISQATQAGEYLYCRICNSNISMAYVE